MQQDSFDINSVARQRSKQRRKLIVINYKKLSLSSLMASSNSSAAWRKARALVKAAKRRKRTRVKMMMQNSTKKKGKVKISPFSQQAVARYMPLDAVFKILSMLPLKSIARFRCVCKQWRSLSYGSDFFKEHQLAPARKLFLFSTGSTGYSSPKFRLFELGDDDDDKIQDCSFQFKFGDLASYELSNSVNGLVCAFDTVHRDYPYQYLLNPFSREVVMLPPSSSSREECWKSCNVGLGIDVTTGVYKLVRLFRRESNLERCGCQVLSVGPNQQWKRVGDLLCRLPWSHPIFVNGTLFWLVYGRRRRSSTCLRPYVMAFDLTDHKLRMISTPEPMDHFHCVALVESGGNLCFVKGPSFSNCFLTIWRLEDPTSRIWTKLHYMEMPSIIYQTFEPYIIGIRGQQILLDVPATDMRTTVITSYNLCTKALHELYSSVRSYRLGFVRESLVSPRSLIGSISL